MSTSKYFVQTSQQNENEIEKLVNSYIHLENDLVSQLNNLSYGPKVAYVYNPLDYASNLHEAFLKKFLYTNKKVLFLGINPGPWGMCQTGVRKFALNKIRNIIKCLFYRYLLVK